MPFSPLSPPGFGGYDPGGDDLRASGSIFATAQGPLPAGYSAVKEPETSEGKIRMLQEMVDALVDENGKKDEEILRLRQALARKK